MLSSVLVYDVLADTWSEEFPDLLNSRVNFTAVSHGDHIYVFGGHSVRLEIGKNYVVFFFVFYLFKNALLYSRPVSWRIASTTRLWRESILSRAEQSGKN